MLLIIATGMTFVISAAEIDLSVGSLLALCRVITALVLKVDMETGLNLPMRYAQTILGDAGYVSGNINGGSYPF